MKIICWNVRGAKKAHILEEVKILKKIHNPDILFLLETLTNDINSQTLIRRMGFRHFDYIPPSNHSGGIWVLWTNERLQAAVLSKETRAIHLLVHDPQCTQNCIISGMYGPAKEADKDIFWNHLTHLNSVFDLPWLLLGDFNELESANDKRGGRPVSLRRLNRLPNFLRASQCESIPVQGSPFSWKQRIHGTWVYERLDRGLARKDFRSLYPHITTQHGVFTFSDHCPIILHTEPQDHSPKTYPFRFQNFWMQYPQVLHMVKNAWCTPIPGTHMFRFMQRLKSVKLTLKPWARSTFGNIHNKIRSNLEKIDYVENQLLQFPMNYRLNNWLTRLLKQREKLLLFNQKYWGRYKRKAWLIDGDRNSSFFQRSVQNRQNRHTILRIRNDVGGWLVDDKDIHCQFITDFQSRLKSNFSRPRTMPNLGLPKIISQAINEELIRLPSLQEIKQIVWDLDPNKTPGPDGFGAGFFQTHWDIIKDDLVATIHEFFRNDTLLRQINHTFLTLIPKISQPQTTAHFRPISLCSTLYKIIAKILVMRLRPHMDKIISPFQSAFIPGRSIHDNILLAHEIMHKFKTVTGNKSWVALKLDMEKAYDRLEWDFLFACLHELGFHDKWIRWIKSCVTSVSYSLLINNTPQGLFAPSRGLRQGDPLSPYLFLICLNFFTLKLSQLADCPKSGVGIKVCPQAPVIPSLMFADDCLLFCQTSASACCRLKNMLNYFCSLSGQLVNFHKSSLVFSKNASSRQQQVVGAIFNIPRKTSLGRYLGCPVFQGQVKKEMFLDLLSKANTKLDLWKANCLSKAGRMVLIQSHLESLPAHTMQCFELPKSTARTMDRVNRDFFWKRNSPNQGMPMVAWDSICSPKYAGGLGLRKTEAVNTAFQCKLAWRIMCNTHSLWVDVMRSKYLKHTSFLECAVKASDSPVWKSIMRSRTLLLKGIRWRIGNGSRIKFWHDHWVDNCSLIELLNLHDDPPSNSQCMVSEFIKDDRTWNIPKLRSVIPDEQVLQKVIGIPLSITDVEDSFCWGFSGSGTFSVKSATWLAHSHIAHPAPIWPFKDIWKMDVPPKIRLFLWQLLHNALPLRDTLYCRGLQIARTCPWCTADPETNDHLFWECSSTYQLWTLAIHQAWLNMGIFPCGKPYVPSLISSCHHTDRNIVKIAFLLWQLWKARNATVFRQESFCPLRILLRAKRDYAEWMLRFRWEASYSSPHSHHHRTDSSSFVRWRAPPPGFIKLNFDGSLHQHSAAGGFLIRGWGGNLIQAGAAHYGDSPILVAEARALRDGVRTAVEAGFKKVFIEGDNAIVIHSLQGRIKVPWQIEGLIRDVTYYLKQFEAVSITHVFREANMAADWLSKTGHAFSTPKIWSYPPSLDFQDILYADVMGRSLERRGT